MRILQQEFRSFCSRFLMNISTSIQIRNCFSVDTVVLLRRNFIHKQNRRVALMEYDSRTIAYYENWLSILEEEVTAKAAVPPDQFVALYGEFSYQAGSWNYARRVICKIEKRPKELFVRHTFIVTNMALSPQDLVRFYCNRGRMENFIKESKNEFGFSMMRAILCWLIQIVCRFVCWHTTFLTGFVAYVCREKWKSFVQIQFD